MPQNYNTYQYAIKQDQGYLDLKYEEKQHKYTTANRKDTRQNKKDQMNLDL